MVRYVLIGLVICRGVVHDHIYSHALYSTRNSSMFETVIRSMRHFGRWQQAMYSMILTPTSDWYHKCHLPKCLILSVTTVSQRSSCCEDFMKLHIPIKDTVWWKNRSSWPRSSGHRYGAALYILRMVFGRDNTVAAEILQSRRARFFLEFVECIDFHCGIAYSRFHS